MVAYFGALEMLPAYRPRSFLFPTGFGTLGFAVPAAIGAKVGRPDARVLALSGDGGLMFTVGELAAAAQARLAIPVVVVDNSGYGEIRREMAERGDPPLGVDFDSPDFAALGRAMGCHGVFADSRAALDDALALGVRSRPPDRHPRARVARFCGVAPGGLRDLRFAIRPPVTQNPVRCSPRREPSSWPAAISAARCARRPTTPPRSASPSASCAARSRAARSSRPSRSTPPARARSSTSTARCASWRASAPATPSAAPRRRASAPARAGGGGRLVAAARPRDDEAA